MPRHCLALDLKNDPDKIAQYEHWHREFQPEIAKSILDAGVQRMQIYRTGNRLFMIMEVDDEFSFEKKAAMDAANPKVQEWEKFVESFQQFLPWAKPGEKWVLMDEIFDLNADAEN